MNLSRHGLLLVAALIACCMTTTSWAALAVPGDFQEEPGNAGGGDWTPATAPLMSDLGGGLWDISLSGLTTQPRYQFKILDDEGTPPAGWGDPEIPDNGGGSPNSWFVTTASGAATIMLDRNTYNDGFLPVTDRVVISTDADPNVFSGYFATGDWMSEAGGADWDPGDTNYQMVDDGDPNTNLWMVDATISVPGNYSFKATAGTVAVPIGSFDYQWGTNGRLADSANFTFTVVDPNQDVTFLLDLDKGAIRVTTGTFLLGDTNNNLTVEFEADFGPIRDNWLQATFLRSEGNLNNEGASNGVVDITDFREWKDACTAVNCASGALIAESFASLGASVPEPSSVALVLFAGVGVFAGRRRRRVH